MLPSRAQPTLTIALLGDRQARTSALLDRTEAGLASHATVHRWDAGTVTRRAMLAGLRSGVPLAVYTGHGAPSGWPTYGGVRAIDLAGVQSIDVLVCLTCHGATRDGTGRSFAESLVAAGSARAVVAAEGDVAHETNDVLLVALVRTLVEGSATTVGELVAALRAAVPDCPYAIVGDVGAPILDSAPTQH
ncbi:MAG TPA: C25 family cysteine peptidase [Actinomycetales bacterium]|nr:C25 family cysteine peptidase [Actinomycetales bacterium]